MTQKGGRKVYERRQGASKGDQRRGKERENRRRKDLQQVD